MTQIIITCPACGRKLELAGAGYGDSVQCPQCRHAFVAAEPSAAPPSCVARPSAPERDLDLDIERFGGPVKFDRHRGPLIKAIGLISLVGGVAFLGVPLVLGPLAVFMGSRDLRAIEDGQMDPRGLRSTRMGLLCGLAASGLLLFVLAWLALWSLPD